MDNIRTHDDNDMSSRLKGQLALKVAVLIPCYNEAITIAQVVRDFRAALPDAIVYVYDNNSADDTVKEAVLAGAVVRREYQQGKGHVVRRMFRDLDADFYVMTDGDNTYDAGIAQDMLTLAMNGPFDLVNCIRQETEVAAYRNGHRAGNYLLSGAVRLIFGGRLEDMLSGYKVLSRLADSRRTLRHAHGQEQGRPPEPVGDGAGNASPPECGRGCVSQ